MAVLLDEAQALLASLDEANFSWLSEDIKRAIETAEDDDIHIKRALEPSVSAANIEDSELGNLEASWTSETLDSPIILTEASGQVSFILDTIHAVLIAPILQYQRINQILKTSDLSEQPLHIESVSGLDSGNLQELNTDIRSLLDLMRQLGQRPSPPTPTSSSEPITGPRR
ncbi:MAG: hypothetical protein KG075_23150 [Alphaproteobacteria bacterium]|nr:hypothetical protein [Alphaproteobacteria bacterium]